MIISKCFKKHQALEEVRRAMLAAGLERRSAEEGLVSRYRLGGIWGDLHSGKLT